MQCPYCDNPDSKVTDSRAVGDSIRRRRECVRCGLRFTTYERVQTAALLVLKKDGRRQEFDRDKLMSRIITACAKRPISSQQIEKMTQDIETQLLSMGKAEVPSYVIGEMVMERLRNLDRIAYVRWASVYKDFKDVESFEQVVKDLREERPKEDSTQLSLLKEDFPMKRPQQGRGRRRSRTPA
jgi:transcriptional repressor NrdR